MFDALEQKWKQTEQVIVSKLSLIQWCGFFKDDCEKCEL